MSSSGLSISIDVLKLAGAIALGVQGLKKFPFVEVILIKFGSWVPIAIAVVAGVAGGVYQYGADGAISLSEAGLIVTSIVAALGLHTGANMAEDKFAGGK